MRNPFPFFALLLFFQHSEIKAQIVPPQEYAFLEIGLLGVGTHSGLNIGLNLIGKSDWLYGVWLSSNDRIPKKLTK